MANQGPKLGECGHFRRLGDKQGDQSYAVNRFTDEANRLYGVLNNRLYDRPYLAGDEYTIADIIAYPWTVSWKAQGQDISEFKYFTRWFEEIGARPAVQRGIAVGVDLPPDPAALAAGAGAPQQAPLQPEGAAGPGCLKIQSVPGSTIALLGAMVSQTPAPCPIGAAVERSMTNSFAEPASIVYSICLPI